MKRKLHNLILRTISRIMVLFFVIYASAVDFDTPVVMLPAIVPLLWFCIYGWANGWFKTEKEDER